MPRFSVDAITAFKLSYLHCPQISFYKLYKYNIKSMIDLSFVHFISFLWELWLLFVIISLEIIENLKCA